MSEHLLKLFNRVIEKQMESPDAVVERELKEEPTAKSSNLVNSDAEKETVTEMGEVKFELIWRGTVGEIRKALDVT
jgi:hypothetical protein